MLVDSIWRRVEAGDFISAADLLLHANNTCLNFESTTLAEEITTHLLNKGKKVKAVQVWLTHKNPDSFPLKPYEIIDTINELPVSSDNSRESLEAAAEVIAFVLDQETVKIPRNMVERALFSITSKRDAHSEKTRVLLSNPNLQLISKVIGAAIKNEVELHPCFLENYIKLLQPLAPHPAAILAGYLIDINYKEDRELNGIKKSILSTNPDFIKKLSTLRAQVRTLDKALATKLEKFATSSLLTTRRRKKRNNNRFYAQRKTRENRGRKSTRKRENAYKREKGSWQEEGF